MELVVPFTAQTRTLLPHAQEPFPIIGRLVPQYDGKNWSTFEQLLKEPCQKIYPDDIYDQDTYLENPDQIIFLALWDACCVGDIRVRRNWNQLAFIENLAVDQSFRGHGLGTRLMDAAVGWAKGSGLCGICLETQDWNLLACRFYMKYGFRLGGIDQMLYSAGPYAKETALYFYLLFS